jgi:hypothetical protein
MFCRLTNRAVHGGHVGEKFVVRAHCEAPKGERKFWRSRRVGYHCPDCGSFYAEADYTIESLRYVLGNPAQATCCGKARPTPLAFDSIEHARAFLELFSRLGSRTRVTLILRKALIVAHFNKLAADEYKRRHYH